MGGSNLNAGDASVGRHAIGIRKKQYRTSHIIPFHMVGMVFLIPRHTQSSIGNLNLDVKQPLNGLV
jgi:hypothetical protein